eukprot:Phypoly_transcript_09872.p1 GENE.Phypoly_transcript_09872~~Phypoly_transcript_09872.p1  ORF type:complete len:334 (+),score=28.13 Phypoly_transcript_09872:67-1068(+)
MKKKALEFYSGIGGFHYSALLSSCPIEIVQSFDIHSFANDTYLFNFKSKVNSHNIETLSAKDIDQYEADIWMMSPPCQPYTRQKEALQKGSVDPRAKSFLHLLDLFPSLKFPPTYILIENVVGFESSDTHTLVTNMLASQNYTWHEFHLSPTQFGIPNQRMRYYLLAKIKPSSFICEAKEIWKEIPHSHYFPSQEVKPLNHYLSPLHSEDLEKYMVPEKVLLNSGVLFDIVYPTSSHCCCFTQAYTHKVEGAGSVLQLAAKDTPCDATHPSTLIALKLRYFTPIEIARMHGFPASFGYPPVLTQRQCYRLIGNSLNVVVVSELIKYLLTDNSA